MADDLADLIADEWHQGPAVLTERISDHLASVLDAEAAKWSVSDECLPHPRLPAPPQGARKAIDSLRAALGITDAQR